MRASSKREATYMGIKVTKLQECHSILFGNPKFKWSFLLHIVTQPREQVLWSLFPSSANRVSSNVLHVLCLSLVLNVDGAFTSIKNEAMHVHKKLDFHGS